MATAAQKKAFSILVEQLAVQDEISYIEALAFIIESNNIEFESVKALISDSLHVKLLFEAESNRTIKIKTHAPSFSKSMFG